MINYLPIMIIYLFCVRIAFGCSNDVQDVLNKHFLNGGFPKGHPNVNISTFVLCKMNGRPMNIVETGTSAWGFDSTRLFDSYVREFGGSVYSVDKRAKAKEKLLAKGLMGNSTHLFVEDSLSFLGGINSRIMASATNSSCKSSKDIDVWFLDSWDVNWHHSYPAAEHGFAEFQIIGNQNILKSNTMIWIDDTPKDIETLVSVQGIGKQKVGEDFLNKEGVMPGKGAFIVRFSKRGKGADSHEGDKRNADNISLKHEFRAIFHEYGIVMTLK
jgi:hypothetical protein